MTPAPDPKLTLTQRLRKNCASRLSVKICAAERKEAAERIDDLESALRELWTLRMMRMSCSVMTAQQNLEYAARSDKAWQEVEKLMGERG